MKNKITEKVQTPIKQLNSIIKSGAIDSAKFDMNVLMQMGMFVLRDCFKTSVIEEYYEEYKKYKNSPEFERTKLHLTEVKISDNNLMRQILKHPEFKKVVGRFFMGNVGLYNFRVVKKDLEDVAPVFLHQDIGYHIGSFDRYSLFIPLSLCNEGNGGLKLYPATHKFGYLGDVGEINDFLPAEYPRLIPETFPGDCIIMHSALWHSSGPNVTGTERIYLDIIIQDANEPSTKEVIIGAKESSWSLHLTNEEIFKNSRSQKLKALYKKVN